MCIYVYITNFSCKDDWWYFSFFSWWYFNEHFDSRHTMDSETDSKCTLWITMKLAQYHRVICSMGISNPVPQMLNCSSLKEVTSCKKFKSSIKWFFFLLIENAASLPCFLRQELLFVLAPWLNERSESLGAAWYLTQNINWLADSYIFPIFTNKKENIH